jgi:hypothetical protein
LGKGDQKEKGKGLKEFDEGVMNKIKIYYMHV